MSTTSKASVHAFSQEWQRRVAEKRASRQKGIPAAWSLPPLLLDSLPDLSDLSHTKVNLMALDIPRRSGIMSEKEIEITESYTVSSLLKSIASGDLTASEVTLAFSKRAAIAHQLVSLISSEACVMGRGFEQLVNKFWFTDE